MCSHLSKQNASKLNLGSLSDVDFLYLLATFGAQLYSKIKYKGKKLNMFYIYTFMQKSTFIQKHLFHFNSLSVRFCKGDEGVWPKLHKVDRLPTAARHEFFYFFYTTAISQLFQSFFKQ